MNGDTITRYAPSGAYIDNAPFLNIAKGVDIPAGLAFDAAGNLYVANFNPETITRYDPSGNRLGTDFVPAGQGLGGPFGLAFDKAGNLYAANNLPGTITRYNSSGNRIGTDFVAAGQGLSSPFGIAFDKHGNLYAANGNNTIAKYDSAGALQFVWGTDATPFSLAFVPEPSTYLMGAIATGLMAVIARRRRKA